MHKGIYTVVRIRNDNLIFHFLDTKLLQGTDVINYASLCKTTYRRKGRYFHKRRTNFLIIPYHCD